MKFSLDDLRNMTEKDFKLGADLFRQKSESIIDKFALSVAGLNNLELFFIAFSLIYAASNTLIPEIDEIARGMPKAAADSELHSDLMLQLHSVNSERSARVKDGVLTMISTAYSLKEKEKCKNNFKEQSS